MTAADGRSRLETEQDERIKSLRPGSERLDRPTGKAENQAEPWRLEARTLGSQPDDLTDFGQLRQCWTDGPALIVCEGL